MSLTIDQQIKSTYLVLRVGAAAIGFALPLLLWGGGKVAGGEVPPGKGRAKP